MLWGARREQGGMECLHHNHAPDIHHVYRRTYEDLQQRKPLNMSII